jgi:predicted AlkP superfamily pyrophosphatase or phosphodiesterase
MTRRIFLAVMLSLTCRAFAQPARPIPGIQKVLIVSIDGLRPDLALRADTPTIHQLIKDGSFTFWARTTAESVTLPSHTSMLTGVTPVRHTIQWNMDLPLEHPIYPAFPTLFELAKTAGYTTAMAAGKSKFIALDKPGTLDWCFIPRVDTKCEDPEVAEQALKILREHKPDVLFVHFPSVDNVGHAIGWATDEQLLVISQADNCLGQLLSAYDDLNLANQTLVIVTADHGGAGRSHGPDDPRSRHIPWIVRGPGIRKGLDLTTYGDLTIDTEDTFCTACYCLGLHESLARPLDGKPVMQIFDRSGQELMQRP